MGRLGRAAGRALRRARRRHLARGRRRRGRLDALGVRDSVAGRACSTAASAVPTCVAGSSTSARHGAGAADPRQLRAPRRGGRRPGRVPGRPAPRAARADHHPGAAGDRRRAGLPAAPARRRRRGAPVRRARAAPPGPAYASTRRWCAGWSQRLDGLPLAIELAAAKVRVMSVDEIDRRLDDRFALLRGGDRSAPDRHQTLLAVIDWSWNLLDEPERRALRWLSVFHDGFTLAGRSGRASATTRSPRSSTSSTSRCSRSSTAPPAASATGCWRRCASSAGCSWSTPGRTTAARDAQLGVGRRRGPRPGRRLCRPSRSPRCTACSPRRTTSPTACARRWSRRDGATICVLVAALGGFWTIKGENPRVIALASAVEDALAGLGAAGPRTSTPPSRRPRCW